MKNSQRIVSHIEALRIFFRMRLIAALVFLLSCSSLLFFVLSAAAQDLAVEWAAVDPTEGVAGDTATLTARIGNNGPGMALSIQYQWLLSPDAEITLDDSAVTSVLTWNGYLYAGQSGTTTDVITIPSFMDPVAPSYFGVVIVDPLGLLYGNNPANDMGSTPFTFTGDPPHGFYDTIGDNYLDAVHVSADIAGGSLAVTVTFSQPIQTMVSLLMGIDLDQNPSTTGGRATLYGCEAMVSLLYSDVAGESVVTLVTDSGDTTLSDAVAEGNTLSYAIPLSLLGGDTAMDLSWAMDHVSGATADFDRAPDAGVYATDTEAVVVRRPGDETIQVAVADPVEGDYPDIQHLDGRVVADQLQLTLTYAHGVDVMDIPLLGDGLFVWVDLDSDGDGEPETIPMGLPVNDMFMRLDGNQIILKIPLVYLNGATGAAALAVTSLDTRNILTGTIDRLPDSGAWDLGKDRLLAAQTCLSASRDVDDPSDDSLGAFGYDNDELVHAALCPGNDALLFSIDYQSYDIYHNGATLIYLDTDRNPATGMAIDNLAGDTTLGADHVLRSYWDYNELKQITDLYRAVDPEAVFSMNQLATPTLADRLYLTLPLECIGAPDDMVGVLVRTASWGGGGSWILLANDDLPDTGVLTVPARPNVLVGDLDADGDVDGKDLAILVGDPTQLGLGSFAPNFGSVP